VPKSANVRIRRSSCALLCAFFLTGATSLIFEVIWTRLLLLSLGTTPVAMGVVLAAFMGGMAMGAWTAGRGFVRRLPPVAVYAGLEAWIGVYALATPWLFRVIDGAPPAGQLALGVAALLPATVAMGTSLPLLVRALDGRHPGESPRATSVGWLYAVNTAGGVTGPLLAVFFLFPQAGLSRTLTFAVVANLVVSAAVWLTRHQWDTAPSDPSSGEATVEAHTPGSPPSSARSLFALLAVSGGTAMLYEVAWTRTLSMVYGSSVYGVSITLSTFLAGIALGSWAAAAWLRRRVVTKVTAISLLAGSSCAAFLSLHVGGRLPVLFLDLFRWSEGGATAIYLAQFLLAAALMLPSTFCLGALLPVVISLAPKRRGEGGHTMVSSLYAANLSGSAVGALTASGLLVAGVGLSTSLQTGVLLALGLSLVLLIRLPVPRPGLVGATVLAVMLILALDGGARRLTLSFGLYHGAEGYATNDDQGLRDLLASHELLFYRDGPTASVAVQQVDRYLLMKINGKTDASNGAGDIETQTLLGHLPLMAAGRIDRVAVVGFGSGMTAGAVLAHPVREVDAFEIEPAVVEASAYFDEINGRPLDDPRLRLVMGDARSELRRQEAPYDVIISEPSNPWITGVANLFTQDFFELAASRLATDGVFAQWFHLYGMSEDAAREVVATFRHVFPHVVAFKDRDLILLGSAQPISFSLDDMNQRFGDPAVRASLGEVFVRYPADLLVKLRLDERGTEAFAGAAPFNTDDNMRLELGAPRTLYDDQLPAILEALDRHPPVLADMVTDYGSRATLDFELAASLFTAGRDVEALQYCERALAQQPTFEGLKLLGQIAERGGDRGRARTAWRRALATDADPGQRALVRALLSGIESAATGN
jgi:spermidine synthase